MSSFLLNLKSWWATADRNQRTVALVGGGFLILLIVGTFMFASKPHMGLLAAGLTSSDQGAVVQELQKQGVPYELDGQGNVLAPEERIPELRAKLALANKLPLGAGSAMDDQLSKLGPSATPPVEKARLKAALESEIAETIGFIDEVQSARVQISMGNDSPFVGESTPASASVLLIEKPGAMITHDEARSIANMVANAVPGMTTNGVSIVNQRGDSLLDPGVDDSPGGLVSSKLATEHSQAKLRERELQQKLDAAFGPGTTIAMVDLKIDFNTKKYTSTTNQPSDPLVTQTTTEAMGGSGSAGSGAGGGAGMNGNPAAPANMTATQTPGNSYTSKTTQSQFVTNQRVEEGQDPAGNVTSMYVTVMVDSKKIKEPKPVEEVVNGYLGPRAADTKNFTATVVSTDFDQTVAQAAKVAEGSAKSADMMQKVFSLLPIGALVFVGMMVLKALGKVGRGSSMLVTTPDGQTLHIPARGIDVSARIAGQLGMGDEDDEQAYSESGDAPALPKRKKKPKPEEEDEDPDVESIKRKINIPLEQIKKMSTDRPEIVAMLIKTWLMEERA